MQTALLGKGSSQTELVASNQAGKGAADRFRGASAPHADPVASAPRQTAGSEGGYSEIPRGRVLASHGNVPPMVYYLFGYNGPVDYGLSALRDGEFDHGYIRFLEPDERKLKGWHLLDVFFATVKRFKATDNTIHHGNMHIIRVKPGEVGIGVLNGEPLILLPGGRHVITEPTFSFERRVALTEALINHSTLHIITVNRGKIGLCTVDGEGHFLGEGTHRINNGRFSFKGFESAFQEHITVGSKHRCLVPAGCLGKAIQNGQQVLIEPGEPRIITTPDGQVGVLFKQGELEVLPPGRVTRSDPTNFFAGFLSTGQQTLPITKISLLSADMVGLELDAAVTVQIVDAKRAVTMLGSSGQGGSAGGSGGSGGSAGFAAAYRRAAAASRLATMRSRLQNKGRGNGKGSALFGAGADDDDDDVAAALRASLFDQGGGGADGDAVEYGLTESGSDGVALYSRIYRSIVERAKLSIATIVGGSPLQDHSMHVRKQVSARSGGGEAGSLATAAASSSTAGEESEEDPSAGMGQSFRQQLHDTFMSRFAIDLHDQCGVKVVDIAIEQVTFSDHELSTAMAKGAVSRTELTQANIRRQVMALEAQADQQSCVMRAEGEARAIEILAEAEAGRIRKIDEAMSKASANTRDRETFKIAADVVAASKSSMIIASGAREATSMLVGQQMIAAASGAASGDGSRT